MKILFVGESWMSYGVHLKGFNAYYTGGYEEGGAPLLEALGSAGHEVKYLRNHEAANDFPNTVDGLRDYEVVIFSDIGADTLLLHPQVFTGFKTRPNPLRALADHVAEGAGFLMVGGYMSFSGYEGKANYHHTALADVLPIRLCGYDDRVELPEGCTPSRVEEHPVLEGLPAEWPPFLGYNKLVAKPEATVPLVAGADPFLALAPYGQGRVAAFASDCAPHWGTPAFVEWAHYRRFWDQLVGWLAGGHQ